MTSSLMPLINPKQKKEDMKIEKKTLSITKVFGKQQEKRFKQLETGIQSIQETLAKQTALNSLQGRRPNDKYVPCKFCGSDQHNSFAKACPYCKVCGKKHKGKCLSWKKDLQCGHCKRLGHLEQACVFKMHTSPFVCLRNYLSKCLSKIAFYLSKMLKQRGEDCLSKLCLSNLSDKTKNNPFA